MKKSLSSSMKSSAKVVDGKLILSFPGASKPVVWQMDFSHVKASALEVQESGDNGSHALVLKTPKGENVEIAAFDNKNNAVKGLIAASKALENAHGKIRPTSNDQEGEAPPSGAIKKSSGQWLAPVLGVLMLLILIMVWSALSIPASVSLTNATNTSQGTGTEAVGVPLSADDFLRAQ